MLSAEFAPRFSRPAQARRRPAVHYAAYALFCLIALVLFSVSGGVLSELGITYDGLTGAMASKVHPATYLAIATFGLALCVRTDPVAYAIRVLTQNPGAVVLLAVSLVLATVIVLYDRNGIAAVFNTYLLAVFVVLLSTDLRDYELRRVERLIHVLLGVNAVLALIEYAVGQRAFPYMFDGLAFEWDERSTALLGHPLENALITGSYLMVLLAGGGPALNRHLRIPMMVLQLAALVAFGGRSALTIAICVVAAISAFRVAQFLLGRRVPFPVMVAMPLALAIAAGVVALLVGGGFFDLISDRFADDGGSANARLGMFEIFSYLSPGSIIIGPDPDLIDSIRRTNGLEWGIENPIVRTLLYQGAGLTILLFAALGYFLFDLRRKLRPGTALPILYFLVIINSFESVANRTLTLAQFAMLMLTMFEWRRKSSDRSLATRPYRGGVQRS